MQRALWLAWPAVEAGGGAAIRPSPQRRIGLRPPGVQVGAQVAAEEHGVLRARGASGGAAGMRPVDGDVLGCGPGWPLPPSPATWPQPPCGTYARATDPTALACERHTTRSCQPSFRTRRTMASWSGRTPLLKTRTLLRNLGTAGLRLNHSQRIRITCGMMASWRRSASRPSCATSSPSSRMRPPVSGMRRKSCDERRGKACARARAMQAALPGCRGRQGQCKQRCRAAVAGKGNASSAAGLPWQARAMQAALPGCRGRQGQCKQRCRAAVARPRQGRGRGARQPQKASHAHRHPPSYRQHQAALAAARAADLWAGGRDGAGKGLSRAVPASGGGAGPQGKRRRV